MFTACQALTTIVHTDWQLSNVELLYFLSCIFRPYATGRPSDPVLTEIIIHLPNPCFVYVLDQKRQPLMEVCADLAIHFVFFSQEETKKLPRLRHRGGARKEIEASSNEVKRQILEKRLVRVRRRSRARGVKQELLSFCSGIQKVPRAIGEIEFV